MTKVKIKVIKMNEIEILWVCVASLFKKDLFNNQIKLYNMSKICFKIYYQYR